MTIPAILDDLLDYEDMKRRYKNGVPTYIWVKKGKKEEAWAVCSLLGLIIDGDVEVDGHPVANTYIFAPLKRGTSYLNNMIGIEGRFNLRDLQIYFEEWETDNANDQPNQSQHPSAYR